MKLKTYIDNSYYVLINSYFIICLVLALQVIILNVSVLHFILGITFLLITLLMMYLFYCRSYIFSKKDFTVKVGFIERKYRYKDIVKSYITNNNRLSYATSKKRIAIKLRGKNKEIYISPERLDEALLKLINNKGER